MQTLQKKGLNTKFPRSVFHRISNDTEVALELPVKLFFPNARKYRTENFAFEPLYRMRIHGNPVDTLCLYQ